MRYLLMLNAPSDISSFDIDWKSEELSKQLWNSLCNSYGHYDISKFNNNEGSETWNIRVFRETVDIDISTPFRWVTFIENFNLEPEYHYPEDTSIFMDYRKKIYKNTLLLGCDEVIYIADQYQGELIFMQIDKPVNDLLNYINNKLYYKELDESIKTAKRNESHQFSRFDIDWAIDTEHNSTFIDIPDFLMSKREVIDQEISIDVLFDDFRDLKNCTDE